METERVEGERREGDEDRESGGRERQRNRQRQGGMKGELLLFLIL